jgi:hypothetical protein
VAGEEGGAAFLKKESVHTHIVRIICFQGNKGGFKVAREEGGASLLRKNI